MVFILERLFCFNLYVHHIEVRCRAGALVVRDKSKLVHVGCGQVAKGYF